MKNNGCRPLFVVLPLIVGILFSCQEATEAPAAIRSVKAVQVADPSLVRSRPFPGVTRAENRVNLSFRVDGPLIDFPVDVGDKVKRGTTLARIDPKDFEVALRNAQANLVRSQASLTFAESDYTRASKIQAEDPGAISQSMVDRKLQDRDRYRAEVESNKAEVEAATDKLQYTSLEAPFDGMIVATYVDNFEYVRAKQSVVRMLDTSRIEMVVDIPEHIITVIPHAAQISITLDIYPGRTFPAKIKEIGTEASLATRTYPVTLVMGQPGDVEILAGMSGEAKFVAALPSGGPEESIIIPVSALFSDKETQKSFVWIVDAATGQVSRREVKVEKIADTGIRILEGLVPGEWIAVAGVHHLHDGQTVEILDANETLEK